MSQGQIALELPTSQLISRAAEIEQLYLGGPQVNGAAGFNGRATV
jgi:hypothetical protein